MYCSQCMYYRPSTDNPCTAPPDAKCIADQALQKAIGRGEVDLIVAYPHGRPEEKDE